MAAVRPDPRTVALGQLARLAVRPSRLTEQIECALGALDGSEPKEVPHVLGAAAVLADGVASIAGSLWQVGLSWLACFVIVRLTMSTWDLPPGPWWNWSLLLGFDPDSLTGATALLAALIAVPIVLCRAVGAMVHRVLAGNAPLTVPTHRALWIVLACAGIVALLVSCAGVRNEVAVSSGCGDAWEPQALGQSWWLLRCPAEARAPGCRIVREGAEEALPAGRRLIVPASQLLRLEFLANPHECAAKVHLARDESSTLGPVPPSTLALKFEPPALSFEPATLSFDPTTLQAINGLSAALTTRIVAPPRTVARGKVDPPPPPPPPPVDLTPLANAIDRLANASTAANRTAADALRLRTICETLREATGAGKRLHLSANGDQACLDAIKALAHPATAPTGNGGVP